MLASQIKTESGCSARVQIYDTCVIGETYLSESYQIPSKLACLAICHIMMKNDYDVDFVKWVKIENDVLTWCSERLRQITWEEHYSYDGFTDMYNKLESVCEFVCFNFLWIDSKAKNCGFYKDTYYCFDALYAAEFTEKELRNLELVFNLESGILDKYNKDNKDKKDE